ncbi:MAG: serine protease [Clostridiales bacterium]|nr:serine protease [Clostridiales bacterium]
MEIYEHNAVHGNAKETPPAPHNDGNKTVTLCLIVACVVLIMATVALAVCLVLRPKQSVPESYRAAYEKTRDSVAEVYCGNLTGSGVVYAIRGGNTYVVTNYHVAKGGDAGVRFTDRGERVPATLCGFDAYHDIALLMVQGSYGTPAKIGGAPVVGQSVLAVGNNLGYGIAAYDGIVSRTNRMLKVEEDDKTVPVYALTCPLNAGMSGGGVFALNGELVALSTYQSHTVHESDVAGDTNARPVDGVSYGVPASIVDALCQRITEQPSGVQAEYIDVHGDADSTLTVCFTGLQFHATVSANGWTVGYVNPAPSDLYGEKPQVGDIVTRIGELTVTRETNVADMFAEVLRYSHDASVNGKVLTVAMRRGEQAVTLTYEQKRLQYGG